MEKTITPYESHRHFEWTGKDRYLDLVKRVTFECVDCGAKLIEDRFGPVKDWARSGPAAERHCAGAPDAPPPAESARDYGVRLSCCWFGDKRIVHAAHSLGRLGLATACGHWVWDKAIRRDGRPGRPARAVSCPDCLRALAELAS